MIVIPAMPVAQTASWHGLMDLHERLDYGWTLVGGQLAHLHYAERGHAPPRPTDDVDTVIDVRAGGMLQTFTATLRAMQFEADGTAATRADREVMLGLGESEESLNRLERAAGRSS